MAWITVKSTLRSKDMGQNCLRNRRRPKERLWSRPVPLRRKSYVRLAILCRDYTLHIGVGDDAASPRPSVGQQRHLLYRRLLHCMTPKVKPPCSFETSVTAPWTTRSLGSADFNHDAQTQAADTCTIRCERGATLEEFGC